MLLAMRAPTRPLEIAEIDEARRRAWAQHRLANTASRRCTTSGYVQTPTRRTNVCSSCVPFDPSNYRQSIPPPRAHPKYETRVGRGFVAQIDVTMRRGARAWAQRRLT